MDDRITDLEIRLAYQDRLITELDEVVREFADRVIVLERELSHHKQMLQKALEDDAPADEKPPHY